MPKSSERASTEPTSRTEKMSILSAMLGPEAMARVRETQAKDQPTTEKVQLDAERVAWHRNKLLERLRQQGGRLSSKSVTQANHQANAARSLKFQQDSRQSHPKNLHLDARLAKIIDAANLSNEHPAVVARLIKTLPREDRVEALKSLPGPMARAIVKRLRYDVLP